MASIVLLPPVSAATQQLPPRLFKPPLERQQPASPEQAPQLQHPGSATRSACPPTTYHVSRLAVGAGDGSAGRPFRQPGQALAAGPAPGHCGIRVELRAGSYSGNLTVTVPTTLHGAAYEKGLVVISGSIRNTTAAPLTIEHLTLRDAPSPGAVDISHASTRTTLRNVTIERAAGYGVRQRGGALLAEHLRIQGTRSAPAAVLPPKTRPLELLRRRLSPLADVSTGSGIFVDGGATATLDDITLLDNRQALVVSGHGTRLRATGLRAEGQRGDPALRERMCATAIRDGFSAVEVRNGALAYLEDVSLDDNEVYGLSVHDGGRAYVGRVSIQRTTAPAACAGTGAGGGINASVRHGGAALEMVDLDLGHARLAGFQVIDAEATLRNGEVHHNPIGVHIRNLPESFDFACLSGDIRFFDNDRNLDADRLPVPGGGLPDGGGATPPCVHVVWP